MEEIMFFVIDNNAFFILMLNKNILQYWRNIYIVINQNNILIKCHFYFTTIISTISNRDQVILSYSLYDFPIREFN